MRETRATGLLVQKSLMRTSSNTPTRAMLYTAVVLGVGFTISLGTARAGSDDDDNRSFSEKIVDGVKGIFKTTNMDNRGIDYRERSPLVVPPRLDLPPPAAAPNDVNANWPKDPDEKRRKAALEARKKSTTNSSHELTPAEAEAARASAEASARPLPQPSFTEKMNSYFGGPDKPEVGVFKGEPSREVLTQPPPGYQIPSPNYAYGVGLKESHGTDSKGTDGKDSSTKQ
jgi:type IV secretory pathway VirB10-like protein